MRQGVKGLRVGVPKEYRVEGMSKEIEALWQQGIQWLKDAGATIHEISLPHTKYALPAYYIVAPPKPPRTSPATTAFATAYAYPARTSSTCIPKPAQPASERKSAAAF